MTRKKLALTLLVVFVVLSGIYMCITAATDGKREPEVFLFMALLFGFIYAAKVLAPGLTGKERVEFTGRGRIPFRLADPEPPKNVRDASNEATSGDDRDAAGK